MPFPNATPDDAWTRQAAASEQVQVALSEGQYALVQLSHARMENYNPEVVTYVEPFSDLERLEKLVFEEFEGSFTTSYKIAQRKGDKMICPFSGRDYGEYPSYR